MNHEDNGYYKNKRQQELTVGLYHLTKSLDPTICYFK